MDKLTLYAVDLIEKQAADYRTVLGQRTVTLDADTLASPLECIVAKVQAREQEIRASEAMAGANAVFRQRIPLDVGKGEVAR